MVKALIVEDSPVARELMTFILDSDPEIDVIGAAENGEEGIEAVKQKRPDIITMDANMPIMNGFEATREIMENYPTPIVIVSATWDPKEVKTTFRAMEAGALTVLSKPTGIGHPDYERTAADLIKTVKLMAEVKVVRRIVPKREKETAKIPAETKVKLKQKIVDVKLVAIGASTGGPPVLQTILSTLPKDFSAPILIVQHIATGFTKGLVEWLNDTSPLNVQIAEDKERLLPGHIYVAPDDFQMKADPGEIVSLTKDSPENGLRPSVSYLFRSIAENYSPNAVGVLLTGMGKDGAAELKLMKEKGAVTIAQDKASSIVYGMPSEAVDIRAATCVLSADKIANALVCLTMEDNAQVNKQTA